MSQRSLGDVALVHLRDDRECVVYALLDVGSSRRPDSRSIFTVAVFSSSPVSVYFDACPSELGSDERFAWRARA